MTSRSATRLWSLIDKAFPSAIWTRVPGREHEVMPWMPRSRWWTVSGEGLVIVDHRIDGRWHINVDYRRIWVGEVSVGDEPPLPLLTQAVRRTLVSRTPEAERHAIRVFKGRAAGLKP